MIAPRKIRNGSPLQDTGPAATDAWMTLLRLQQSPPTHPRRTHPDAPRAPRSQSARGAPSLRGRRERRPAPERLDDRVRAPGALLDGERLPRVDLARRRARHVAPPPHAKAARLRNIGSGAAPGEHGPRAERKERWRGTQREAWQQLCSAGKRGEIWAPRSTIPGARCSKACRRENRPCRARARNSRICFSDFGGGPGIEQFRSGRECKGAMERSVSARNARRANFRRSPWETAFFDARCASEARPTVRETFRDPNAPKPRTGQAPPPPKDA